MHLQGQQRYDRFAIVKDGRLLQFGLDIATADRLAKELKAETWLTAEWIGRICRGTVEAVAIRKGA